MTLIKCWISVETLFLGVMIASGSSSADWESELTSGRGKPSYPRSIDFNRSGSLIGLTYSFGGRFLVNMVELLSSNHPLGLSVRVA